MKLEAIITEKVSTTGESESKIRFDDSDGMGITGCGSDMQSIVVFKSSMTFVTVEPGEGLGEVGGWIIWWMLTGLLWLRLRHGWIDKIR